MLANSCYSAKIKIRENRLSAKVYIYPRKLPAIRYITVSSVLGERGRLLVQPYHLNLPCNDVYTTLAYVTTN